MGPVSFPETSFLWRTAMNSSWCHAKPRRAAGLALTAGTAGGLAARPHYLQQGRSSRAPPGSCPL